MDNSIYRNAQEAAPSETAADARKVWELPVSVAFDLRDSTNANTISNFDGSSASS